MMNKFCADEVHLLPPTLAKDVVQLLWFAECHLNVWPSTDDIVVFVDLAFVRHEQPAEDGVGHGGVGAVLNLKSAVLTKVPPEFIEEAI